MKSIFDKTTLKQLTALLEITVSTKEKEYDFIQQKFQTYTENWSETYEFLKKIGLINQIDSLIELDAGLENLFNDVHSNDSAIKQLILKRILSRTVLFSEEIFEYLEKFTFQSNEFEYAPNTKERIQFSGVRNLLMELEFILHDRYHQAYRIAKSMIPAFLDYIEQGKQTIQMFKSLQRDKERIGLEAEEVVMTFERERLAKIPLLLDKLEHTARKIVNAGFDIKSWEIPDVGKTSEPMIPRYIEVKAVSDVDFRFYWSRNEIEKARILGNLYHLYLVPIGSNNDINLRDMLIIRNPYSDVYRNGNQWCKHEEIVCFSKKER